MDGEVIDQIYQEDLHKKIVISRQIEEEEEEEEEETCKERKCDTLSNMSIINKCMVFFFFY